MPSRSDHTTRGGIVSNIDQVLSKRERAVLADGDDQTQKFVDYKKHYVPEKWHGSIQPFREGPNQGKVILPEDQINVSDEEIRLAWQMGRVPKPFGVDPNTGNPMVDENVKQAWRLGYACPNCWNAQESIIDPQCQIKGKKHGCGYKRSLSGW